MLSKFFCLLTLLFETRLPEPFIAMEMFAMGVNTAFFLLPFLAVVSHQVCVHCFLLDVSMSLWGVWRTFSTTSIAMVLFLVWTWTGVRAMPWSSSGQTWGFDGPAQPHSRLQ